VGIEGPAGPMYELPGRRSRGSQQRDLATTYPAHADCHPLQIPERLGHGRTVGCPHSGGDLPRSEEVEQAHRFRRTERQVVSGNAPVTPARAQHRGRGRVAPAEQLGEGPRLHRSPQPERRGTVPRPGAARLAGDQRPFGPPWDEIVDVVAVAALPHDMHLQHCSSTTAGDLRARRRCVTRQTHPTGTEQIYATEHCHRACRGAARRRGSRRVPGEAAPTRSTATKRRDRFGSRASAPVRRPRRPRFRASTYNRSPYSSCYFVLW
jgi:hypothetical protein